MSRRRALSEQQAIDAEAWFTDYERVGTLERKANELRVSIDTLRDAIARVRKVDPRPLRRKLSVAEIEELVSLVATEPNATEPDAPESNVPRESPQIAEIE